MRNISALTLPLLAILGCNGCAVAGPAVKITTAAMSAASARWSYKALQQDPVNVTTLSKECTFIEYVRIPCEERAGLSEDTKRAIADNNRLAVELCNRPRPEPLVCP